MFRDPSTHEMSRFIRLVFLKVFIIQCRYDVDKSRNLSDSIIVKVKVITPKDAMQIKILKEVMHVSH